MPITKNKKTGMYKATKGSSVLTESDFADLQEAVDDKIKEIVSGIREGRIDIRPMREKGSPIGCRYCEFRPICRFDQGFRGCGYNDID
jgi:ATP-dependent helicase/nuclease subunit B